MKISERKFYQEELASNQNNMRKSWAVLKEIINKKKNTRQKIPKILINGKHSEDAQEIANLFNNFFTNIGATLDKKNPKSHINPISFLPKNYTVNIFLQQIRR